MPPKKNKPSNSAIPTYDLDNLPFDLSKLSDESRLIVSILMYTVNNNQENFTKAMESKDKEVKMLSEKVKGLERKLELLDNKMDEKDVSERSNEIIISGFNIPVAQPDEDSSSVVRNILKDNLKLNVSPVDIIKSYRIGKKNSAHANDIRSIHVKLSKQELKNDIIATSRSVKPDKLFFNENLSPIRNSIMFVLRKAKKDFPNIVSGCNSIDGSVFVWIKSPNHGAPGARDSKMRINDHNKLNYFCTEIIGSTVETYIPEWQH